MMSFIYRFNKYSGKQPAGGTPGMGGSREIRMM
jgi:hypothetical protein